MTVIMKLKASLGYLEEVRKHISRLPALPRPQHTHLAAHWISQRGQEFLHEQSDVLEVDVQVFFHYKALYVGHMDHRFLRWQVIDTRHP